MPSLSIPGLIGGLNSGFARERIDAGQSPRLRNFTVKDGVACKRTGYAATSGVNWTASKKFFHGHHYQDGVSGKKRFWGFGEAVHWKDAVGGAWSDDASGTWTPTAGSNNYYTTTEIVELDDYKNHLIVTQADTKRVGGTFVEVAYTNEPETDLADLVGANGYNDLAVSATGGSGTDASPSVITSAGSFTGLTLADYQVYLSGTNCTTGVYTIASDTDDTITLTANASSGGAMTDLVVMVYGNNTTHYCKQAINVADHLMLLHPREYLGGAWRDMFQRVRWSRLAHFTSVIDWDDTLSAGAGYQDLRTDYGAILGGEMLRTGLTIYLEQAIYACYHTGSSTAPFHFDCMLAGLGLYAPRLIASNGESHFLVGSDHQIYQYYGGRDKQPIGDKIKTEFFENINKTQADGYAYADRAWAFALRDLEAVVFAIPTGSANSDPTLFYVYFWRDGRWDVWDLADTITGMGNYEKPASVNAYNLPIFSGASGTINQLDYSSANDVAAAIDAYIETKDFVLDLQNEYNAAEILFEASGDGAASSVAVSISVDGGETYSTAVTVTVGTTWALYKVNTNVAAYLVRVKFANAVASQKLLLGGVKINVDDSGEGF